MSRMGFVEFVEQVEQVDVLICGWYMRSNQDLQKVYLIIFHCWL